MAAEVDAKGNWYVFPTVVQLNSGKLREFDDVYEAMDFNIKRGNFKKFKDKDKALKYAAGGYKTKAMENYDPMMEEQQKAKLLQRLFWLTP